MEAKEFIEKCRDVFRFFNNLENQDTREVPCRLVVEILAKYDELIKKLDNFDRADQMVWDFCSVGFGLGFVRGMKEFEDSSTPPEIWEEIEAIKEALKKEGGIVFPGLLKPMIS